MRHVAAPMSAHLPCTCILPIAGDARYVSFPTAFKDIHDER